MGGRERERERERERVRERERGREREGGSESGSEEDREGKGGQTERLIVREERSEEHTSELQSQP